MPSQQTAHTDMSQPHNAEVHTPVLLFNFDMLDAKCRSQALRCQDIWIAPWDIFHMECCVTSAICELQRQKAAKRGSAKAAEEEVNAAGTVHCAPAEDQFVTARLASIPVAAAAASRYPAGMPLAGLSATAPAQAAGPQGVSCLTRLCHCVHCFVAQIAIVAVSICAHVAQIYCSNFCVCAISFLLIYRPTHAL